MTGPDCIKNIVFWGIVAGLLGFQKALSPRLALGLSLLGLYNFIRLAMTVMHRQETLTRSLTAKWNLCFDNSVKTLDAGFIYYSHEKEYFKTLHANDPNNWSLAIYQHMMNSRFKALENVFKKATLEEKMSLLGWLEIEQASLDEPFILAPELVYLLKRYHLYLKPASLAVQTDYNSFLSLKRYSSQASILNSSLDLHQRLRSRSSR